MNTWLIRGASKALYYTLWTVIVAVSVHDGYLVLLNRWTIERDESNPLGRWLIAIGAGDVHLFLIAKLAGTIAVATVLLALFRSHPRFAWVVCTVLALVQSWLFVYLTSH